MIVERQRKKGAAFQVYAGASGKKAYVGTFATADEARQAEASWRRNQKNPLGTVTKLRITAVYENGVERELREFDTGCVGMIGFEAEHDDLMVFATGVPRRAEGCESVADPIVIEPPVRAWVRERCSVIAGAVVQCGLAFEDFRLWVERSGRDVDLRGFPRDLIRAVPGVARTRKRLGAGTFHVYEGLTLRGERPRTDSAVMF